MTNDLFVENTPAGRPPRSWDFFLTIFLLFLLLLLTGIFVVLGFGLGVTALPCADSSVACNYSVISAGTLIVLIGTPLVAVAGIVMSVVWIARRKISFVIPLIACLVVVALFIIGSYLVDLAVP